MRREFATVAILLFVAAYGLVKAGQQLEKGPSQQFWDIHQYPIKEGINYVGTIHVFKFQVGHNMVCKAMFFKEDYRFEKEDNSNDDTIAMASAMTATSLGDVPCD